MQAAKRWQKVYENETKNKKQMKNYLFIIILISIFSCKMNIINAQEKTSEKTEIYETVNDETKEIGILYQPEKIETNEIKSRNKVKKNDYEITITNSDLLDTDSENIKTHTRKIADIYYSFLIRINIPFVYNNIIVKIIHRNGKIENFKYQEKDFLSNSIEFSINTKFTLKVTKINNTDFKYTILKAEPYDKKLEMWNTENLFNENGETETIEFYFAETTNNSNMLVMQSRSKYSIKFKSEIQTEENGEFNEIQNVGTHKGSKTTESWAKKTYKIRLSNFELKN